MSGGNARYQWADEMWFPAVRELWRQGFPEDTDADIAAFWRAMSGGGRCLLRVEEDVPVSMAFLLSATGRTAGQSFPLWYVYAAATRRDHRGQGRFQQLLDEAATRAVQCGVAALFLRPAEPSLFSYYARCGFRSLCRAAEIEWQGDSLVFEGALDKLRPVETGYADIRRQWLSQLGRPYVDWSPDVADYAVRMAQKTGGGAVLGTVGAALCERDGDRLLVRELLCSPADRLRLIKSLTRYYPCQEIRVNTLPAAGETGVPFGMVRPCGKTSFPEQPLYMGLTLE